MVLNSTEFESHYVRVAWDFMPTASTARDHVNRERASIGKDRYSLVSRYVFVSSFLQKAEIIGCKAKKLVCTAKSRTPN